MITRDLDPDQVNRSGDFAGVLGQADYVHVVTGGSQRTDLTLDPRVAAVGQVANDHRALCGLGFGLEDRRSFRCFDGSRFGLLVSN